MRKSCAPLLRPFEALFPTLLHPCRRIQTRGLDLYVDARTESINENGLAAGDYESIESDLLERIVRPGDTFVDVGANVGFFTCQASQWVGEKGHVFAVEPDRVNFRLLRRNVRANTSAANVTLRRAAASSENGTTVLHRSLINCGDHRIYEAGEAGRVGESVRTIAVDTLIPDSRHVDFVKIDVQGAETLAFRGMQWLMRENAERIAFLIEWWPHGLTECGSNPAELWQLIEPHGLRLWTLQGEPIEPTAPELFDPTPSHYVNLIATKEWRW